MSAMGRKRTLLSFPKVDAMSLLDHADYAISFPDARPSTDRPLAIDRLAERGSEAPGFVKDGPQGRRFAGAFRRSLTKSGPRKKCLHAVDGGL